MAPMPTDAEVLGQLSLLVTELARRGSLQMQADKRNALLRTTVVPSDRVPQLLATAAELMGPPVKPAGASSMWRNWFDPFFKAVGGAEKPQSLFRRELADQLALYVAFWPWASDPGRTSLRIGLACWNIPRRQALELLINPPV